MRVEIRGCIYESAKAAARAKRVRVSTVYCAVSRRTTDTLGLGRGNRSDRRGGRPKQPVTIGPLAFPSMSEASRALGFDRRHVQKVLRHGKETARANLIRAAMAYVAKQEQAQRAEGGNV